MFKVSHNRALLSLEISTRTPLSIRAGDIGLEPGSSDMVCIRTRHAEHGATVFIPGSSLRGVIRSTAEAALRGALGPAAACDPADQRRNCGSLPPPKGEPDGASIHRASCLACRLFGSTTLKARCSVRDLFPFPYTASPLSDEQRKNFERANSVEVRPGVFIGRLEGSVRHGPFEQEMVPAGVRFFGDIALENYQFWQLGLLLSAIDELDAGFSQLGSGKSKGLGVVQARVVSLLHQQRAKQGGPKGVAALVSKQDIDRYGLKPDGDFPNVADNHEQRGFLEQFSVSANHIEEWKSVALRSLAQLVAGAK